MLVSKLFPSACSIPGAGTGWGITFSSPWESQESTLLPMLPEKGVSQAGTPPIPGIQPLTESKIPSKPCCTLDGARAIPLKHGALILGHHKSHLLFHFFNGSRKQK